MEQRKTEIETLMSDPDFYKDGEQAKKTSHEYKEVQAKLTDAYYSWNKITEEISLIESAAG